MVPAGSWRLWLKPASSSSPGSSRSSQKNPPVCRWPATSLAVAGPSRPAVSTSRTTAGVDGSCSEVGVAWGLFIGGPLTPFDRLLEQAKTDSALDGLRACCRAELVVDGAEMRFYCAA